MYKKYSKESTDHTLPSSITPAVLHQHLTKKSPPSPKKGATEDQAMAAVLEWAEINAILNAAGPAAKKFPKPSAS